MTAVEDVDMSELEPAPIVVDVTRLTLADVVDIEAEFDKPFSEIASKESLVMSAFAWLEHRKTEPNITWREAAGQTLMTQLVPKAGVDDPKDGTSTDAPPD